MRKYLSIIFYCLASLLIVTQLSMNYVKVNQENKSNEVIHSVSREKNNTIKKETTAPQVNYQEVGSQLTDEKY